MAKHIIDGFITYRAPESWDPKPYISFSIFHPKELSSAAVVVRPHSFEVEIPDNFDPRPLQVEALKAEKTRLRAELGKQLMNLDNKISKLLAISNDVIEA